MSISVVILPFELGTILWHISRSIYSKQTSPVIESNSFFENIFTIEKNNSIYIEIGKVRSSENLEDIDLEIIEAQTGEYLEEDDIVKINDIYDSF